jgi:hypothetical protein
MRLIGRYDKIRGLSTQGSIGPPLILDHKWGTVHPAQGEEWWRSPKGYWIPIVSGGIAGQPLLNSSFANAPLMQQSVNSAALSINGQALNAASGFTFGSAGNAVAFRVKPTADFLLKNIYYYISAVNGTQANVNSVDVYIRNAPTSITVSGAGATLYTSATANPNTDSSGAFVGWHQIALPSAFTLSVGQYYWILLSRTQNATDYPTIAYSINSLSGGDSGTVVYPFVPTFSSNGYSSLTASAIQACLILEDTNGNVAGNSITQQATVTSANRRGLRFIFSEKTRIYGLKLDNAAFNSTTFPQVEIYDESKNTPGTNPNAIGNAPIWDVTNTNFIDGYMFRNGFVCARNMPYRLVASLTASATAIQKFNIGQNNSYVQPTRRARLGGGNWWYAHANGTTDWNNDDQDALPLMVVFFDDQVAAGASQNRSMIGY